MTGNEVGAAYTATGSAWAAGPGRIYDRLAEVVVGLAPVPLDDRLVLDVGAGTGAASRAIVRSGGRAIATDISVGMLAVDRWRRPPAVVGDASRLPFVTRGVDGVVAAFSLNHVADAAVALREARRVTAPGGPIAASTYAADDSHPVKAIVEAVLQAHQWEPPDWYRHLVDVTVTALNSTERCVAVAAEAGLAGATVHAIQVPFEDLDAPALVAWRLGMAHCAPFVAGLDPPARAELVDAAVERLGVDFPPLVRSVLVITAVA